ncbi:sugar phosphate isomerase/epimerase family protein [Vagococcus humatus]|uniref:Sugar phosphate isomerase/epimerase n=1 Tax=Vagococcus humatus TaxID=1889241 RepID=A0A3S0A587_9ENTE|nr:sugar phosphate isomerase/epimerase [Vagococcus humatus]RST89299.1 sugar phosphate isomerase/epimerase [Vagococcus humatus]
MKLGLETESYHIHFQHGRMDIFDFIEKTVELGLDGVQINIIEDLNLNPEWGCLGSNDPDHLKKIKTLLDKHQLYCEIDMRGVEKEKMVQVIDVANVLGAKVIRTYINKGHFDPVKTQQAVDKILSIEPLLKKNDIHLAIENHEEEIADEVVELIEKVNSPYVGCLCDIGNGMMAWEDPKTTVDKLLPYAKTTHFKDHIVIKDGDQLRVSGCPIGYGNIDTDYCFKKIVEETDLTHINIEMCHPYVSYFKRPLGLGGVEYLGEGAFKIEEPYFDPAIIKPMETYHPSAENLEMMLKAQDEDVKKSVTYMKKLRDKYCS